MDYSFLKSDEEFSSGNEHFHFKTCQSTRFAWRARNKGISHSLDIMKKGSFNEDGTLWRKTEAITVPLKAYSVVRKSGNNLVNRMDSLRASNLRF